MTLYDNDYQRNIAGRVLNLYKKQIEHEKRTYGGMYGGVYCDRQVGGKRTEESSFDKTIGLSGFANGYNRDDGFERVDGIKAVKKGGAILPINTDHQRLTGGDFLDDVMEGFTGTLGKVANVAQQVAPLAMMLAAGKKKQGRGSIHDLFNSILRNKDKAVDAGKNLKSIYDSVEKVSKLAGKGYDKPVVSQMKSSSFSGGKKPSHYNLLVKKVMENKKMSLPEAKKYIKENGLYRK
jgi:hypothetical protein